MIVIVSHPQTLLDNFRTHLQSTTTSYDSAMLITLAVLSLIFNNFYLVTYIHIMCSGIDLDGKIVGYAPVGRMCSRASAGITQDTGTSVAHVSSIAAHELGHIFAMTHDDGRE